MKNFAKMLFLSSIACFTSVSTNAASVITNGSFESASVDPGAFLGLPVGSTAIDGWAVILTPIHYMGTFWDASDGVRSVDLDGGAGQAGGIEQTFATNPGTSYTISFDMSGNFAGGPTIKPMRVLADGQSADFTFDITGISATNMGYVNHTWAFTADDDFATLQFISLNSPASFGPVIDNVSVNAVPIPASVWLFGSGLLGLVGISRRNKIT